MMRYGYFPEGFPLTQLRVCECGAVVLDTRAHDAYHDQNDRPYP